MFIKPLRMPRSHSGQAPAELLGAHRIEMSHFQSDKTMSTLWNCQEKADNGTLGTQVLAYCRYSN